MNNAEQNSVSTQTRLTNLEELDLEKFKLSRTSQPIASLSSGLVVDELMNGMQKLGVKGDKMPNNADLLLMYKSIMDEYPNVKIGEISLAFDLAAKGKLDIDAETYQNFSMLYLHRILRAFARYGMQKLNEIKPVAPESKWQPRFITDDEKIETAFDCYTKFRIWDSIVFGLDVFHILHKQGKIIVDAQNTYDKVISAMNDRMFNGSRQDKIDIKNKLNDDDFLENQCKRMAVSQHFDKLLKA